MLFPENVDIEVSDDKPLPERLRPSTLDGLIGQDTIWAPGSPLRLLVEQDRFYSLIFWGPPGCGKTSLAHIIGRALDRPVVTMSAVHASVKDIRAELDRSSERLYQGLPAQVLFLDELHRLSKSQQDVLLPALESGQIKFIGATTENPSFRVNSAINSRSLVFRFSSLSCDALVAILKQALTREGWTGSGRRASPDVLRAIAESAGGDARKALNLLDALFCTVSMEKPELEVADLESSRSTLALRYDRAGEDHFDLASALIKSIRGSHPDAAVYYLARMLDGGEDPLFIARRLVIAASEDIGNANPTALLIATSGMQAVQLIGMPEARITLSQVATYLAASPKSNRAYVAIGRALEDVRNFGSLEVPMALRNAPTELMKNSGYGKEYAYAHDNLEKARQMKYLPSELRGRRYYEPSDVGVERQLKATLTQLRPTED